MIQLYHGDCLELMKGIPDGSVDMVLADPPYGTTQCKWDNVIDIPMMWEQLNRVMRQNGGICLFGSEPFSSILRVSNIKNYKYDWVWDKGSGGNPFNNKIMPMKTTENILVFEESGKRVDYYPVMVAADPKNIRPQRESKQKTEIMGRFKNGFKPKSNPEKRFPKHIIVENSRQKEINSLNRVHPTQKPVALMEYLIKTYTNEGETVLDFTMGSGTTGVACVNLNRDFIGIELDQTYFDIATKRIKEMKDAKD